MVNDKWCLVLFLEANEWNDSPTRETPLGELFQTKLNVDKKVWNEVIDFAIENGCDSVMIRLGNGIKYNSHPEIAIEGAWTPKFMNAEVKRLKEKGLKVYPALNFSASHDAWLGVYSRMVSTPEYYKVARELIHEVIDIFDKPEMMNLGYDEENGLNQVKVDYACYRQYDLKWHDLNYLLDCVREKGVRPVINADYAWSYPDEFEENVPKDVLLIEWYYNYLYEDAALKFSMDNWSVNRRASFKRLTEAGYDIMMAGSSNEQSYNFEHMIRYAQENLNPDKVKGMAVSGWWGTVNEDSKYYYMDAIYKAKFAREKLLEDK